MSTMVPAAEFELHVARSEFIDKYNLVDSAIRKRLEGHDVAQKQLLSQNIELLEKVAANPQYSKQQKIRVDGLLAEFKSFQPLRCDVVHGPMKVVMVDQVPHAIFLNVQKQSGMGRSGLMVSAEELRRCSQRMAEMATALQCALNSKSAT